MEDVAQAYLASGLVEAKMVSQLFLTDRTRRVDLVAEDKEGNLGELFDTKESIELGL